MKYRKILTDIRDDDLRASAIIRHIRLLMRKQVIRMEPLDVNEVAQEAVRLVEGEARRRNVTLRTELIAAPAAIVGDRYIFSKC